ncbi:MAG: hypothetical protein ACFE8J_08845 [Candidatus Heimdallarchaeota archaeon]
MKIDLRLDQTLVNAINIGSLKLLHKRKQTQIKTRTNVRGGAGKTLSAKKR